MSEKKCIKCDRTQPIGEFYRHVATRDKRLNECRTCTKARNNEWRNRPGKREHWNRGRHQRKLFLEFGITKDQFDDLYRDPECYGCGAKKSQNGRRLALDHDHKTGRIRGLLCHDCNRTIATAHDSPTILRKLAEYLERDDICF